MSDVNRREFVTLTIAAAATAGICACGADAFADDAPPPKAAPKTPFDVGPKSDFSKDGVVDKYSKPERILMVRNEGKIYAINSTCTHKNCAVKTKNEEIVCPCHGSRFSVHGTSTKGPAKGSLLRFALSVNDKGNIIVDRSKTFEEKHWDDPAAFLTA
jgi:cytochrome b6-f complex iron-sulfur subunit